MAPSTWQPLSWQGVQSISGPSFRIGMVNVGTMRRSWEVEEMLGRRKVDISYMQEVQFNGEGSRMIGRGKKNTRCVGRRGWWRGGVNVVGMMVREDLIEDVIEVRRMTSKIMLMTGNGRETILCFFSVCPLRVEDRQGEVLRSAG